MCTVDDKGLSKLCRFYMPIADDKARRVAGMELGWLDAHPFSIAGATPGAEVKVVVGLAVAAVEGTKDMRITWPPGEFPSAPGPEITAPLWEISPYESWADRYVPDMIARMNKKGEVAVRCIANEDGTLSSCWVMRETAPGLGLGEAVPALLQRARLKTVDAAGAPVAGRPVVVTMKYDGLSRWPPSGGFEPHWAR